MAVFEASNPEVLIDGWSVLVVLPVILPAVVTPVCANATGV